MTQPVPLFRTSVVATRPIGTPKILWRALWGLWALDVLVLFSFIYSGRVHYNGLKVVGYDSAPSIIAAQQIRSSLADMDADAANELLAEPGSTAANPEAYSRRRQLAASALIKAAEAVKNGADDPRFADAERQAILSIEVNLGRYDALVQQARDLRSEGKPGFLVSYQKAAALMDWTILPAGEKLDGANYGELENAYSREQNEAVAARAAVGLAGLAFLALLLSVQVFLFKRTNRVFNLPLLAATVLLTGFMAYSLNELHTSRNDLRRAKVDAFTSIHALWQAWAVAYSAKDDESRYLLDAAWKDKATHAFYEKRDWIATLHPGETYDLLARSAHPSAAGGYLAEELNNITFAGEQESADETLRDFARYVDIDGRIRSLESQGRHKDAVELCLGRAPWQSNWAFNRFGAALARTLKINQDQFDSLIKAGFNELANFGVKAAIVAVVIGILCLLGLMQRIREYN